MLSGEFTRHYAQQVLEGDNQGVVTFCISLYFLFSFHTLSLIAIAIHLEGGLKNTKDNNDDEGDPSWTS